MGCLGSLVYQGFGAIFGKPYGLSYKLMQLSVFTIGKQKRSHQAIFWHYDGKTPSKSTYLSLIDFLSVMNIFKLLSFF
jgi:hypothetical protein